MQLGSMFISNCNNTIILYYTIILLQLLINILPSCITWFFIYINVKKVALDRQEWAQLLKNARAQQGLSSQL
jgi:hypothetical protein